MRTDQLTDMDGPPDSCTDPCDEVQAAVCYPLFPIHDSTDHDSRSSQNHSSLGWIYLRGHPSINPLPPRPRPPSNPNRHMSKPLRNIRSTDTPRLPPPLQHTLLHGFLPRLSVHWHLIHSRFLRRRSHSQQQENGPPPRRENIVVGCYADRGACDVERTVGC